MKHLLFLIVAQLILLTTSLFGQIHLSANLRALGDSRVIIEYYEGDSARSITLPVISGKFIWKGPLAETQKITMIFPGRAIYLFVEPGTMTITGSRDSLEFVKITGSKTNDEAINLAKLIKPLEKAEYLLYPKYGKLKGQEEEVLENKINKISRQKDSISADFIFHHNKSALSLNLVSESSRLGTYEFVSKLYSGLDNKLKLTAEGRRIASRLAVLKRSEVGQEIIQYASRDNNGREVALSEYRGKYVFIDFWASWCAPCRAEIPNLIYAYNKYKDNNFTVLSISLDDQEKLWKDAILRHQMPWTQVSGLKGWKDELASYYGIMGIPSTLLLDPDGKILAKDLKGLELNKKLEELFR